MPLNVEIPLGSSPLCEAVIKILEGIDGLESVRVGPAVFHAEHVSLGCCEFNEDLKLLLPIQGGYRVFLVGHYRGYQTTGTNPAQLCARILAELKAATLPKEVVTDDRFTNRPNRKTATVATQNTPPRIATLHGPIIVPPQPPSVLSAPTPPTVIEQPTGETIMIEARNWADDNGIIEGLMPRLLGHFGNNNATLVKALVADLIMQQRLEYLGPNAVTEPYRKHRILPEES